MQQPVLYMVTGQDLHIHKINIFRIFISDR